MHVHRGWCAGRVVLMPGNLPEAMPGSHAVDALLKRLVDRVRRLEAAIEAQTLAVLPYAPASTSSSDDAPLYSVLPTTRPDRLITVTVFAVLSDPTAEGTVKLVAPSGQQLDVALVHPVNDPTYALESAMPTDGPYTITGSASAGTLTVTVLAASAPAWISDDDA